MSEARRVFDLASAQTAAVIAQVPSAADWDRPGCDGLPTLRDQLRHLALVRESILCTLAGEDTAGLGQRFETEPWLKGDGPALGEAFGAHTRRCRHLLSRVDPATLDRPFPTPFGNLTTPKNYLRMMLLEETHHRAQMIQALRILGLEPPEYPGRAWVELGISPEEDLG